MSKKQIYLSERKLQQIVKEVIQEAMDNGQNIPSRLYHGTTFEALNDIMDNGYISAKEGKRTGETSGMNWFSTQYSENFSRGVVISFAVTPEDFKQRRFKFMNDTEVVSYGEYEDKIPIQGRDFRIEQYGSIKSQYDFDQLKNLLERYNDDIFDVCHTIDKFYEKRNGYIDMYNVDNPIFVQLIKQIGREDLLKEYGLV